MGRILIVDDEPSDGLVEQAILERAGHEIVFAASGEDALAQCRAGDIDIVITDLQMPDIHGFELITALREVPGRPPIIAVSSTGPYQLEMADALGAKFTLSKPIDPHQLITAVEQLMRYRSSERRRVGE